jgi:hypothetical protein
VKSTRDPAAIVPDDRLTEVATILATGFGRLAAARSRAATEAEPETAPGEPENDLAVLESVEPSCDHAVNSREKGKVA